MGRDNSRFLMLFIDSDVTRFLLMEQMPHYKAVVRKSMSPGERSLVVLEGSRLPHDSENQQYYLRILSRLKTHISDGDFVVLSALDSIYGVLYDLFNQRFSMDSHATHFCQVNYGDMKDRISIHPKFGCLLLKRVDSFLETRNIERRLPSPLLNRFEKHILTLENYSSDAGVSEAIKAVKKVLQECLESPRVFDNDELRSGSWKKLGNELIFCFHNGDLVDFVCIRKKETIKGRSKEDNLRGFEQIWKELFAYFSCKMVVLFFEWITTEPSKAQRGFKSLLEDQFLGTERPNSLAELVAHNGKLNRTRSIVLTFSRNINYPLADFERISLKSLESEGFRKLENELKAESAGKRQKTLLVSLEDSGQFGHLRHLKRLVDDISESQGDRLAPRQVVFVVHQTGEQRAKVFHPNRRDRDWETHFVDELSNSYYR